MSSSFIAINVFNSLFNSVLLGTIVYVCYRNIVECNKVKMPALLFIFGLLLNVVAFACLSLLLWKAVCQISAVQFGSSEPLFFGCHLVFLQHLFLIMVMFIRIHYIFRSSHHIEIDLALSARTISFFIIAVVVSSTIFTALLTTKLAIPGTTELVNCAITLCVFNLVFLVAITSLFVSKLTIVFRYALQADKSADINKLKKDNAFMNVITKTTLLSLTAMSITFVSCFLLLFRFTTFGNDPIVSVISDLVVSIDIYSNFLCYSLSFKYFHPYYFKLCRFCDLKYKHLWQRMSFGAPDGDVSFLAKEITAQLSTNDSEPKESVNTNVSPERSSTEVTERPNQQGNDQV
eukprot:379152_1